MMDVLHFLFEEDFTSSEEAARSRSAIRDTIFRDLYGVSYSFKMTDPKNRAIGSASNEFDYSEYENSLENSTPVDPRKKDPFSPRNEKSKTKFVDASSVPLVEQSFEGLDAPLN